MQKGVEVMLMKLYLEQTLVPKLVLSFGETIGDIPIYSLHRIKNLLSKKSLPISSEMKSIFLRCLLEANEVYKKESGNNWSCLTSHNLIQTFESMDSEVISLIEKSLCGQPSEYVEQIKELKEYFLRIKDAEIGIIKEWFDRHSHQLLYDTNGHIPWIIIHGLRKKLSLWSVKMANPFNVDIESAIMNIATENSITAETAEEAWSSMGGKIFHKKKK